MVRGKLTLIKDIKRHILALGFKFMMVPESGSLVMLKEGGKNNHFLLIQVAGSNPKWEHDIRHFSLAKLKVNTFTDAHKGIAKYLNRQ
jgi:hypothetical protein